MFRWCDLLLLFDEGVRDIKPHNFVLTPDAHVLLIDFGSAAPLLPPKPDGSQIIPNRYCLVPCGTCDYISPEILQAHEEALVALEMDDDEHEAMPTGQPEREGYGVETDWWSLGAMSYEMAYGVAPFFANDIRQTYIRIMNHEVCFFLTNWNGVIISRFCRRVFASTKRYKFLMNINIFCGGLCICSSFFEDRSQFAYLDYLQMRNNV